jgi:hypothetical protein
LWWNIVRKKYCRQENIFYSEKKQTSHFWKGVILAAQAVKLGYRWVVGNENTKTKTVAEVWVNEEIRLTFRRAFSADMMSSLGDLKSVS